MAAYPAWGQIVNPPSPSGGGGTAITSCTGDLGNCTQTGAVLAAQVLSGANIAAGTIPNAALVTAALTAASTLDTTKLSSAAMPTGVTGSPTLAVTNFTGALPSGLTGSPAIALTNVTGAIPSAVTATTQSAGDNSTKVATTAYADVALTGDTTKPAGSNATTTVVTHLTNPLPPAQGGVGAGIGFGWLGLFGTGADGPSVSGTANIPGVHDYTTWECSGTISLSTASVGNVGTLVILASTSITLDAGCVINGSGVAAAQGGMGGAGGSGGGGTAASSAASENDNWGVAANGRDVAPAAASGASGGIGTNGALIPLGWQNLFALNPIDLFSVAVGSSCGGSAGSAGGSSGGVKGQGGACVVLISPLITINNGAQINVQGTAGVGTVTNTQGGGGGGGGGYLIVAARTITDNSSGTYYRIGGGAGGPCTGPNLQLANAPGDSTGDAGSLTVTGLTTGGLDATKITITAAGTGYTIAPIITVNALGSGLTGSPAAHTTISGGAIASVVVDTAGSGGTLTTATTCGVGGQGSPGTFRQITLQ